MKKLKRSLPKQSSKVEIRVTEFEKNYLKGLAFLYAGGNLSAFLVWCAMNAPRKQLTEDDMRESHRRIKKIKNP